MYDLVDSLDDDDVVISGGCDGVDTWAENRAKDRGLETDIYLPDFSGCSEYYDYCNAYYERNRKIVENSDVIYAFVSEDRTGGTENTIKHAKELEVPVKIME